MGDYGVSEDSGVRLRTAGGGHRPQEIGMSAGQMLTKMKGTAGDGRG